MIPSMLLSDVSSVPLFACISPILALLGHLLAKWKNSWHLKHLTLLRSIGSLWPSLVCVLPLAGSLLLSCANMTAPGMHVGCSRQRSSASRIWCRSYWDASVVTGQSPLNRSLTGPQLDFRRLSSQIDYVGVMLQVVGKGVDVTVSALSGTV